MIQRSALREQVRDRLHGRILDGSLVPGTRLKDTAIAAELGVSRTPVREALLYLEREGIVTSDVGRGFLVRHLDSTEVREKYPIMWTLEVFALRNTPLPSPERLAELRRLNAEIGEQMDDPIARVRLDTEWHSLLLAECPNAALLDMITALKANIRRYEVAYMFDSGPAEDSLAHHDAIVAALEAGDVDRAAVWLERNWAIGIESLVSWLDADPKRGGSR